MSRNRSMCAAILLEGHNDIVETPLREFSSTQEKLYLHIRRTSQAPTPYQSTESIPYPSTDQNRAKENVHLLPHVLHILFRHKPMSLRWRANQPNRSLSLTSPYNPLPLSNVHTRSSPLDPRLQGSRNATNDACRR